MKIERIRFTLNVSGGELKSRLMMTSNALKSKLNKGYSVIGKEDTDYGFDILIIKL